MREKSETLIRLSLKITFLSNIVKHFPWFIPFHQAAKLFPPPSIPMSQKQHTFSLKLKSIHRQSMQTLPFKHSQTLLFPLSRKVTPVLSDVPLLNSRAYVPSSTSSSSPSSSCTRRKTHERTRPSENRLAGCAYIRLQTLFQGVAECVGAWGTFGDRRQPPSPHRSLPAKRNPLRLAVSRDLPVITRNPEEERKREREEEAQGGQGSKQWQISSKRFVSSDRKVLFERLWRKESRFRSVWRWLYEGLARWCDGWRVCRACGEAWWRETRSKWFRRSRYLWSFGDKGVSQGLERGKELGLKS